MTGDSEATVKGSDYWEDAASISVKFIAGAESAVGAARSVKVYRTTSAGVGPTLLVTLTIAISTRRSALSSAVTINNGDLVTVTLNDTNASGARITVTGVREM